MTVTLGLDIGSNSVGSAWIDTEKKEIVLGVSVFPAGVEDSEDKRGKPRNAERALARRSRVTLARRSERKRLLRKRLIEADLLPAGAIGFRNIMAMNPWVLRRKALTAAITPYEFGRVLIHLNQRRGALGVHIEPQDFPEKEEETPGIEANLKKKTMKKDEQHEEHAVKQAIGRLRLSMLERYASEEDIPDQLKDKSRFAEWARLRLVTVGRFLADEMDSRRNAITSKDKRRPQQRPKGNPRVWCSPVRNQAGRFEFHADRELIRQEFALLWDQQVAFGGPVAKLLNAELRRDLDDPTQTSQMRHKGIVFGQRLQTWDLGTLGRCALEPAERCVPHADRFASYYRVVGTVNDIRIIDAGERKPLTVEQRELVLKLLRGPWRINESGKKKGQPKTKVSVSDIRIELGLGKATRASSVRLNIENDPDRDINTDWFYREIVHGAIGEECWKAWDESRRELVNRAILKFNPEDDEHAQKLRTRALSSWWGCTPEQTERLIAAWRKRPKLEERAKLSRRAIRNVLAVMDAAPDHPSWGFNILDPHRWLTQVEARQLIAGDCEFRDVTTGKPLDEHAKRRYATGAKGMNKRDRLYQKKHLLKKDGEIVYGDNGEPIAILPPAPMLTNPVVRKAIHEVRSHIIAYLKKFGKKPDFVRIELAREARMTKKDADRALERNRRRNRIRNSIVSKFGLANESRNHQKAAVERVVLAVQQGGVCPLCNNEVVNEFLCPTKAASGVGVQVAHLIPQGKGGPNKWVNKVLAHEKCNQDMLDRTPRDLWGDQFKENLRRVEKIYKDRVLPKKEDAVGQSEWPLYFDRWEDHAKLEMFSKTVKNLEGFRESQLNDTRYATRQVMAYLADALFEGKGLPERGGPRRRIFASTGGWTGKFRREWGLFLDPHGQRANGLTEDEQKTRHEKNRGDHREHAIDALVTALATEDIKGIWEQRAAEAEHKRIDEDEYRRQHPIFPSAPWQSVKELQLQVRRELLGQANGPRPVAHRPIRKIVGYLHRSTLYGAVLDGKGNRIPDRCTVHRDVFGSTQKCLKPDHLRLGHWESSEESIDRIAKELRDKDKGLGFKAAKDKAAKLVKDGEYHPKWVDPNPEKSGLVRDRELRRVLREQLKKRGLNPDSFTPKQLQATIAAQGPLTQKSGVPIKKVVLLWSNSEPVVVSRSHPDPQTGARAKQYDATTDSGDIRAARIYDSQNNAHIEIRQDVSGSWSGTIVKTIEVAQRNTRRLQAVREFLKKSGVQVRRRRRGDRQPPPGLPLRAFPGPERKKIKEAVGRINSQHPLVDRSDDPEKGGTFVMSLAQGETIFARRWDTKLKQPVGSPDYFVVAKLDPPNTVVLVPHWDGRRAKGRKDEDKKIVPQSQREAFAASPGTLFKCGPEDGQPPYKVRVDPLGRVATVQRD